MEFRILGALEAVSAEGHPVRLGGSKQRALLGILLLNANIVVSRERLIDLLWGEDPPGSAVNALQVHVHGLRKVLDPGRLKTQGSGYSLRVAPGELDLELFIDLCDEGRGRLWEGDALGALDSFVSALAQWRGAPFADLVSEPFGETEAARLEELRLAAVEDRVDAELRVGRHRELVPELTTLVKANPYRERLQGRLMLALFRAGRQADALEAYQRARDGLAEELGLDPSEELRGLQAAILRRDPSLMVESHELRARRHLPAPATELIGRRAELDEILALLGDSSVRLLTLTGPGGTGKTRLALRAAHESAQAFADGVFFVDLSPLRDPRRFASTLAHSLDLDERADQPLAETLQEHLRARELLLVLDNFEHVEEAAPLVSGLLAAAPGLKAMVTSRSPLRLYGEHLYAVLPLAEEEAIALYLARARAAGSLRGGGVDSSPAVTRICVALDYLPLAIELAAARSDELSLQEMEELLSRRLELAVAGPRDAPERQQTLRTAVGWSYELLDDAGARVLRRAAVFAGSFSSEAAVAICEAHPEDLQQLVDSSLIRRLRIAEEPRFAMLETIREFALEQLQQSGELDAIRAAHAAHYAGLAEQGDLVSAARSVERDQTLDALETEMNNFRAALDWSLGDGEYSAASRETALQISGALGWFWWIRGHAREGRMWVERALERAPAGRSRNRARCLHTVGILADLGRNLERAEECLTEAVRVFEAMGDKRKMSSAMNSLAIITRSQGHLVAARVLAERCLALRRELDDRSGVITCLSNLGVFALDEGDLDRAQRYSDEARALNAEAGDLLAEASDVSNLGAVALQKGELSRAGELMREALSSLVKLGDAEGAAEALGRMASLAAATGDAALAARLSGASDALMAEIGMGLADVERRRLDGYLERARAGLGRDGFSELQDEGRRLSLEEATELALYRPR